MATKIGFKRGGHGTLMISAPDIATVKGIHGNNCVQVFAI